MTPEQAAALRAPFGPDEINKKPQPLKKNAEKGRCRECSGYHGLPAIHLDYVGHAAATDRFLQVDPGWTWEPLAVDERGLPAFDHLGGLWIRLTVAGTTRLGYGFADGQAGGNAVKETIGDALRNAGMRFGVGLDLWRKEDSTRTRRQLEYDEEPQRQQEPSRRPPAQDEPSAGPPGGALRKALGADIARIGTAVLGLSQTELHTRFAGAHGTTVAEASTEQLRAFRDALRAEAEQAQRPAGEVPAPPDEGS